MAKARQEECPERGREAPESKGSRIDSDVTGLPTLDDAIVVDMRYVYILRCQDDSLYIGESDELMPRVDRHNEGRGCRYTASRLPVRLVYAEQFAARIDAIKRERQLKGWTREKKDALIAGDPRTLKRLSRSRQSR